MVTDLGSLAVLAVSRLSCHKPIPFEDFILFICSVKQPFYLPLLKGLPVVAESGVAVKCLIRTQLAVLFDRRFLSLCL